MAWLSRKYEFIYIPCQRTGSKSLRHVLKTKFAASMVLIHHDILILKPTRGHFYFTTVRNPYFRMLSVWWRFKKQTGLDYAAFLYRAMRNVSFADKLVLQSQSAFLTGVPLNAVLHHETLERDFNRLPFVKEYTAVPIHKSRDWRRSDKRGQIPFRDVYSGLGTQELLLEHSGEDFERFGYSKELPDVDVF